MNKIVMDEKTRQALLGALPFSQDSVSRFTPKLFRDVPKKFQPVFLMRSMTTEEKALVTKISSSGNNKNDTTLVDVIRNCLTGWETLYDLSTGNNLEFFVDKEGNCKKDLFDLLPVSIVSELSEHLLVISGITLIDKISLK